MPERGRIAFITTPEFRKFRSKEIKNFVFQYLYPLCSWFEVLSTGRTFRYIKNIIKSPAKEDRELITKSTNFEIERDEDLDKWREPIIKRLKKKRQSVQGMIELAYELVEGRLDAIIHLTDWGDISGKPDSQVLRRQANVHDIPIASDIDTAEDFIANWLSRIARDKIGGRIFPPKKPLENRPLERIRKNKDRVLALIAHDQMKLDMCCFVVQHKDKIFNEFDYILATGTTGSWIKRFAVASGRDPKEVEKKVRCCLSGPYGGDVQIAKAVVEGLCQKVIFLQDPFTSHPHATDIKLFEQSVLLFQKAALKIDLKFATNVASAKDILGV